MTQARLAGAQGEVPVGAVVAVPAPQTGWRIVSRGQNTRETAQDPCGHAEIQALREAARALGSWRLEEAVLFVTLEPCPMCLAAAQAARVRKVVFSALDPKGGALSLGYPLHLDPRTNHRFLVERLENLEAGRLLSEFFKARR